MIERTCSDRALPYYCMIIFGSWADARILLLCKEENGDKQDEVIQKLKIC